MSSQLIIIHCREATVGGTLAAPQQYGIWEVEGLGLVAAFRGTASQEDVLIDVNITPTPLEGTFPRGRPLADAVCATSAHPSLAIACQQH